MTTIVHHWCGGSCRLRPWRDHGSAEAAAAPLARPTRRLSLDTVLDAIADVDAPAVVSAAVDGASGAVRLELEAPTEPTARDVLVRRVDSALAAAGASMLSVRFVALDGMRWTPAEN